MSLPTGAGAKLTVLASVGGKSSAQAEQILQQAFVVMVRAATP